MKRMFHRIVPFCLILVMCGSSLARAGSGEEGAAFLAEAREVILKALEECTDEERADALVLTEIVRTSLKRYFRKRTSTRPMIVPLILEV